jgi:DNA-binding transcriptional MocR family regulator
METQTLVRQLGVWSRGKGPLRDKLAMAIVNAVRQGVLAPGVRVPSERSLADALQVSRTTVVAAYDVLRDGRWLESHRGSGTRVSPRSPVVSAARHAAHASALAGISLLTVLNAHEEAGTINFALGTPAPLESLSPDLFTLPADEHASLLRDWHYHPLGLPVLRRAIAQECTQLGLATDADEVLVTNGAQQAIALCASLCLQRGDSVLVEDPTYFGALDVCRTIGARISGLPVGEEGVSPSAIRDRVAATGARLIYLMPTFQNPTGSVMPESGRREIGKIVAETGVPLIDDRTMADLMMEGSPPLPLAACAPKATVFTIGSLSKLVWPGLRIGWVRAAPPMIQRLVRLKTAMDLGSPLFTQAIGARVVGAMNEARALRRRELKPRRDVLASLLRKELPEWEFRVPTGGLFFWTRLPGADAREFAQVAFRHGIVTLPGTVMSPAEEHVGFLRLPFFADLETLRSAVDCLAGAWHEYRGASRERRQSAPIV